MDGGGEGGVTAWLIDVAAAGLLAAACAFVGTRLAGTEIGWAAGAVAMGAALAALRRVQPEPRRFLLPAFAPPALPAVESDVLELTEVEPLLLEDVLAAVAPDSRVVRLFAEPPLPTAGELVRRIESHLGRQDRPPEASAEIVHLEADASAALREALADLRRSLG